MVAFDTDEPSINGLYGEARRGGNDMLPLVMDFKNPSPEYGICGQLGSAASERLQCDLVLGLALVHHLVYRQRMTFEQIAAGLSRFSKRRLLVEFVPREDKYVSQWWSEQTSWYTKENFKTALGDHFGKIRELPSTPDPRLLLLCEK